MRSLWFLRHLLIEATHIYFWPRAHRYFLIKMSSTRYWKNDHYFQIWNRIMFNLSQRTVSLCGGLWDTEFWQRIAAPVFGRHKTRGANCPVINGAGLIGGLSACCDSCELCTPAPCFNYPDRERESSTPAPAQTVVHQNPPRYCSRGERSLLFRRDHQFSRRCLRARRLSSAVLRKSAVWIFECCRISSRK